MGYTTDCSMPMCRMRHTHRGSDGHRRSHWATATCQPPCPCTDGPVVQARDGYRIRTRLLPKKHQKTRREHASRDEGCPHWRCPSPWREDERKNQTAKAWRRVAPLPSPLAVTPPRLCRVGEGLPPIRVGCLRSCMPHVFLSPALEPKRITTLSALSVRAVVGEVLLLTASMCPRLTCPHP